MNGESIQGVVVECSREGRLHGMGAIWYLWKDEGRLFPEDVRSVMIVMPVIWGGSKGLVAEWTVDRKNQCNAQWSLSGTREKPTLSPSLNWSGVWHGWLEDGFLRSC